MTRHDPHSYSGLTQGKIYHINLRIKVDFETHILNMEADYRFEGEVTDSLFLDTSKIDLLQADADGQDLQ